MWGTDMITTWTGEGQTAVLAGHLLETAVGHHGAECIGLRAARCGTRIEALRFKSGVSSTTGGTPKFAGAPEHRLLEVTTAFPVVLAEAAALVVMPYLASNEEANQ